MARNRQVAFLFDEAGDFTAEDLGGKAMSLVTMTRMGLPVPPGFAIPTGVCRAYLEHARFPRRLQFHVERCMRALEQKTGKRFGDPSNPLLVSVRSGAPKSMPGMMDTILNLGITQEIAAELVKKFGSSVAGEGASFPLSLYGRFLAGFRKVTGSEPSKDPWKQLWLALEAVSMSWLNDRAVEYRRVHQIPENLGTAMIVQEMIFGNLDERSGTGVVFSRNVATGERELYGEFLPQAQGEDLVSGAVTPLPISKLAEVHSHVYNELAEYCRVLERRENDVIEIEFTVDSGRLWTLQYRKAKRTPSAAARFAVQMVWEKRITKEEATSILSESEIGRLRRQEFVPGAVEKAKAECCVLAYGIPASPGAVVGIAAFSSERACELAKEGKAVVLIRPETNPEDFAGMLASSAIVTERGGATSHAAVVARELGIPAVVGAGSVSNPLASAIPGTGSHFYPGRVCESDIVSVDGTNGVVVKGGLTFVSGVQTKEVSIFLKWLAQLRLQSPRRANFEFLDESLSANTILNDFYLSDFMASEAESTKLEKEAKVLRSRVHREAAEVFVAYLLIAVAGELRHGWVRSFGEAVGKWKSPEFVELEKKFGVLRLAVDPEKRFDAQMSVVNRLRYSGLKYQQEFLELAIPAFRTWETGSTGGRRWAKIAQTALDYLSGLLSDSLFVDRVFDLRHNGGVLFDKHPMFSAKTWEDLLKRQLDAKRADSVKTVDDLVRALAPRTSVNPFVSGVSLLERSLMLFEEGRVSSEVKRLWEKGKGWLWWKDVSAQVARPEVRQAYAGESHYGYGNWKY